MTVCFHILVTLTLVIIQTTLIPYFSLFQRFYDLPLLFVIYLGLYRPLREGFTTIIILGLVMDSLCGSPLGVYLTSYFWIYSGCIWFLTFLQVHNTMLLSLIVALAIVFENLIFIIGLILQTESFDVFNAILPATLSQVLWSLITAPWLILFFGATQNRLIHMQKQLIQWYNDHWVKQN
jgi:rod shape-determining protein MreD